MMETESEQQEMDKKVQQLAAARAALVASGKSPRQIGVESRQKVLSWAYCWGYTSSTVIQELLCRTSGGYTYKLIKQGWLLSTRTKSGIPAAFVTLTELGLQEAERHASDQYRYPESDPYRVDQQLIRHNLIAQKLTVSALRSGGIVGYQTERVFMQGGDESGVKHPDVIWITGSNLKIGIEIELSSKWDRDLDQFVLAIIKALQADEEKPAQFSRFIIFSDSPKIIERYQAAMKPSAALKIWEKNERKHWSVKNTIAVSAWLTEKVDFQLIER